MIIINQEIILTDGSRLLKKKNKISADPSFLRPRAIQSQYFSNARTLFLCTKWISLSINFLQLFDMLCCQTMNSHESRKFMRIKVRNKSDSTTLYLCKQFPNLIWHWSLPNGLKAPVYNTLTILPLRIDSWNEVLDLFVKSGCREATKESRLRIVIVSYTK